MKRNFSNLVADNTGMIRRRMSVVLPPFDDLLTKAIAHYWKTPGKRQGKGAKEHAGRRVRVTGHNPMEGFCGLVNWLLLQNGLEEASVFVRTDREIPESFRPTKDWDMLIVHGDQLVAALDFNNRTEDALGDATDLWTAHREGAFGKARPRPWLGWVMLLREQHFKVVPDCNRASPARRYELLSRKLVQERICDAAAFVLSPETEARRGSHREPAEDLTMKRLLAGLVGHVGGYLAAVR